MKARFKAAAGITAIAAAAGCTAVMAGAANEKYSHDYTIENVMSDYLFFTSGDLNGNTHIVGSVAAGGNASLASWGEGQISPTYIGNIEQYSIFASGSWVGENKNSDIYFNTIKGEVPDEGSLPDGFKRNENYIDFSEAMSKIEAQSVSIADKALTLSESALSVKDLGWLKLNYITIDVSQYNTNSFEIPYELYSKADVINFIDSSNDDFGIESFAKGDYRVSITGVNGNPIEINYQGGGVTSSTDESLAYIKINDQDINFKQVSGSEQGGQINMTGIKAMLNLPDASGSVKIHNTQGQIVAPKANVIAGDGTIEGGIIGKNITAGNEAHFYPYYPLGTRNRYENGGEESSTTTTTTEPTTTTTTTEPTTTTTTTEPTTTTTTTEPTTTTTTTEPTTTTTTTEPTTTTTTTEPTTTTTTTEPTTTTTTTEPTTTTTTTEPTTTTTTTEPTTTTTTTEPTTTTTTTEPTTTTTTTEPTTTTTTTEPTTTTTTTEPTTTTTTTEPTTTTTIESTSVTSSSGIDDENDLRTSESITTTTKSGINNADQNRNTTASKVNNAAASVPKTGAGYTSIAVVSLLTAAAVVAIGKKKFNDSDKD